MTQKKPSPPALPWGAPFWQKPRFVLLLAAALLGACIASFGVVHNSVWLFVATPETPGSTVLFLRAAPWLFIAAGALLFLAFGWLALRISSRARAALLCLLSGPLIAALAALFWGYGFFTWHQDNEAGVAALLVSGAVLSLVFLCASHPKLDLSESYVNNGTGKFQEKEPGW